MNDHLKSPHRTPPRVKRKRFRSAFQIESEIDFYKRKMQKQMDAADALDIKADRLFKSGGPFVLDAEYARAQAYRLRKAANRIREHRLGYLKDKLAEFRTMQLPALDNHDPSIPG